MENARLMTETREALERQTATRIVAVINSSLAIFAGVRNDAGEVMRLCDAAFGYVYTYNA